MEDSTHAFLELLKCSIGGDTSRAVGIHTAYMVFHIWLGRNSLVFDSRWCSMRFILERALIVIVELIDVTFRSPKIWDFHFALTVVP